MRKRKLFNGLVSIVVALLLLTGTMGTAFAQELSTSKDVPKVTLEPLPEEFVESTLTSVQLTTAQQSQVRNTSGVDLSTSSYFPAIRSQGSLGSCSAFSTVYYQFTYEANKLNGINSRVLANCYSPMWPFWDTAKLSTNGYATEASRVYDFLKNHGAMKWNDDVYSASVPDSITLPGEDKIDEMRAALNTRVASAQTFKLPKTQITAPNDSELDLMKLYLIQGKVLRVSSYFDFEHEDSADTGGKYIIYRFNAEGNGHSYVIVGYDDTVSYDVNGNGYIDSAERGAFKIANSHGTNWGDSGYAWILYDALNEQTAISGNWETNIPESRSPAFVYGESTENTINFINVANYDVNFVAQLQYENVDRNKIAVKLGKYKDYTYNSWNTDYLKTKFTGEGDALLLFDYSPYVDIVEDYMNVSLVLDFRYTVVVDGNIDSTEIVPDSYKITDNIGNVVLNNMIEKTGANSSENDELYFIPYGTYYETMNLTVGDINYDGNITVKDANMITRLIAGQIEFSNVQYFLGDFNGDGSVTTADAQAILNYIANT